MALADQVVRLQEAVTTLTQEVKNHERTIAALSAAHSETAQKVAGLRAEHDKEVALLKKEIETAVALLAAEQEKHLAIVRREIEELKGWKDDQKKKGEEWERRLWAFGPSLLAAIVGGLLVAAVNYFIPRH